ncbi:MAG: divalent-cation tolerance protein CutA [Pseudomonadota bacterium]
MIKLLYATFASKEEALSIAHKLLQEKLIACANVLDGSTSVYRWQGEVQEASEVILFAKTTDKQAQKAASRIKELHSYELPCVLILPVESGLPEFMEWVETETS